MNRLNKTVAFVLGLAVFFLVLTLAIFLFGADVKAWWKLRP
ncbi:MAG: hypothetical protein ABI747_03780 [Candidatus Moraniibacteriota bacterium]